MGWQALWNLLLLLRAAAVQYGLTVYVDGCTSHVSRYHGLSWTRQETPNTSLCYTAVCSVHIQRRLPSCQCLSAPYHSSRCACGPSHVHFREGVFSTTHDAGQISPSTRRVLLSSNRPKAVNRVLLRGGAPRVRRAR